MFYPIRMGAAVLPALAVSFVLFFLVQALIAGDDAPIDAVPSTTIVDFVRVADVPELIIKTIKPTPPPAVDEPPPLPKASFEATSEACGWCQAGAVEEVQVDIELDGGFSDGAALPIVKVQPSYPRRAQERGLSGWVLVQFDVSPQGAVTAPVVI